MALSCLNKNKEAIEAYDKVIELNPDDVECVYNKGLILIKINK